MRRDLPPLPWERTRANLDDHRDHSTALRCRNGLSLHRPRDRRDFLSAEFREGPGAESCGGNISANKTAFSLIFCSYLLRSWTCLVMRAARVHQAWPASPYWMSRMACHHLDAVIEGDVVCSQIVEALRRIWGLFVPRR